MGLHEFVCVPWFVVCWTEGQRPSPLSVSSRDCSGSQDTSSGTASTTGNSRRFLLGCVKGVGRDCIGSHGTSSGTTPNHWQLSAFSSGAFRVFPGIAEAVRIPLQGQPRPLETLGVVYWCVSSCCRRLQLMSGSLFRDNPFRGTFPHKEGLGGQHSIHGDLHEFCLRVSGLWSVGLKAKGPAPFVCL